MSALVLPNQKYFLNTNFKVKYKPKRIACWELHRKCCFCDLTEVEQQVLFYIQQVKCGGICCPTDVINIHKRQSL